MTYLPSEFHSLFHSLNIHSVICSSGSPQSPGTRRPPPSAFLWHSGALSALILKCCHDMVTWLLLHKMTSSLRPGIISNPLGSNETKKKYYLKTTLAVPTSTHYENYHSSMRWKRLFMCLLHRHFCRSEKWLKLQNLFQLFCAVTQWELEYISHCLAEFLKCISHIFKGVSSAEGWKISWPK